VNSIRAFHSLAEICCASHACVRANYVGKNFEIPQFDTHLNENAMRFLASD
jgi:hypothetical protein